ncbi:MAG TPA: SagB/ThcOx family dehydrogenase [Vicinamibacterales bacterium]|nr:SagB/ThcOx family dehydrogenase [Vicinamibacterales bacterium]
MFALEYHEATKHHFNRFARSAGYLDWATQPNPFRRYAGAPVTPLPRDAVAPSEPYTALFAGAEQAAPIGEATVADFLRCAMGLSAWKEYRTSRWALRVNPSSGNLHPTEAYLVWNSRVSHYAPREHALEERCRLRPPAMSEPSPGEDEVFLVALTSIFWREAWKYGERAFRYCQHDVGHAIGALRFAAARLGWQMTLVSDCSDEALAALLGLDRESDFMNAEREAPECLAVVARRTVVVDVAAWVVRAREGAWSGVANRLSSDHRDWPIIDRVASATAYPGRPRAIRAVTPRATGGAARAADEGGRAIILRRRSAVAFDARSSLPFAVFGSMLDRLRPGASPWDAIDWPPQVHLALFVHRVDGLLPGLYAFLRDPGVLDQWRAALRPDFLWEPVSGSGTRGSGLANDPNAPNPPSPRLRRASDPNDLFLLLPLDMKWPAARVSCDQDIAGDGYFSLGMIARFEPALREHGEWFYRRLFWECGLIGQALYLEAEAAGARATGIGCFYDDPVHELLGLSGRDWQSLYHFSMGIPVEDDRLMTEPGYEWEAKKEEAKKEEAKKEEGTHIGKICVEF